MTNEEKELLTKDLLGRVLYGVKVDYHTNIFTLGYNLYLNNSDVAFENYPMIYFLEKIESVKPYLRPMSSITEEEITEIYEFAKPYIIEEIKHGAESDNPDRKVEIENGFLSNAVIVDELNKRHIDYRGLIPMGLALPATEDMYK